MLKVAIKYKIIDMGINIMFNSIIKSFTPYEQWVPVSYMINYRSKFPYGRAIYKVVNHNGDIIASIENPNTVTIRLRWVYRWRYKEMRAVITIYYNELYDLYNYIELKPTDKVYLLRWML